MALFGVVPACAEFGFPRRFFFVCGPNAFLHRAGGLAFVAAAPSPLGVSR